MKSWYAIKAAAPDAEVVEISILSEIGYWGVNAVQFDRELRAKKGSATKAKLFINSPGGDVFEGVAVLHMLRASGLRVEVQVLGIAASIASVIAMAGDEIVMPKNTMMFVHNPISGVYGNAEDMRQRADDLDKVKTSIDNTYLSRFKGDAKALDELLARETYLTADECLEYGFCDRVIDAVPMEAKFDVEQLPDNIQALFKRTEPAAPPQTPLAARIVDLAKAKGLDEFAATFAGLDSFEAAEAAMGEAIEIKALAAVFEMSDRAAALIRERKPLADARAFLNEERVAADREAHVDNTQRVVRGQPQAQTQFDANAVWAVVREANKQLQRSA